MTKLTSIFGEKIDKIGKEMAEKEKLRRSIQSVYKLLVNL